MKLRSVMLPTAALMVSVSVLAGEEVDIARDVPSDPVVSIENVRGEVRIEGWNRDEITVTGELDDLAEGLTFEVDGKDVLIEVEMPKRDVNWGDGSDLVIRLPVASRISFKGVSSDVEIEETGGGAKLQTVSGDIEVEDVSGPLLVNSVSGDVEIFGATARASVSTISGDIEMTSAGRELKVESVSGDIEVELADFVRLNGRSVSGTLELSGRLVDAGRIDLGSVSGDIRLELDSPVNAELEIEAGIGGDISNDLTDDKPRDIFPSRQELIARAGDGSGRIRIETVSADIRLN